MKMQIVVCMRRLGSLLAQINTSMQISEEYSHGKKIQLSSGAESEMARDAKHFEERSEVLACD